MMVNFKAWFIVLFVWIVVSIYNGEARLIQSAIKRGDDGTFNMGKAINNVRFVCQPFYDDLRKQQLKQFSVFWVGNEDYSSQFKKGFEGENLKTGNYFVAARALGMPTPPAPTTATTATIATTVSTQQTTRPPTNADHSESIVLAKAEAMLAKYTKDNGAQKPDVFLYTLNSPCFRFPRKKYDCSTLIPEWAQKHKDSINSLVVAWDQKYKQNSDNQFLSGLAKLIEKDNIKILYPQDTRERHFCTVSKTRVWFQRAMHGCLQTKVSFSFPIPGCNDGKTFKRDLAKFVNRITWRCGKGKPEEPGDIKNVACWTEEAKKILGVRKDWMKGVEKPAKTEEKIKERVDQLEQWRDSFDAGLIVCVNNKNTEIGPAISPKQPDIPSSSAEETKGLDGGDDELCFTDKNQSKTLGATAN